MSQTMGRSLLIFRIYTNHKKFENHAERNKSDTKAPCGRIAFIYIRERVHQGSQQVAVGNTGARGRPVSVFGFPQR